MAKAKRKIAKKKAGKKRKVTKTRPKAKKKVTRKKKVAKKKPAKKKRVAKKKPKRKVTKKKKTTRKKKVTKRKPKAKKKPKRKVTKKKKATRKKKVTKRKPKAKKKPKRKVTKKKKATRKKKVTKRKPKAVKKKAKKKVTKKKVTKKKVKAKKKVAKKKVTKKKAAKKKVVKKKAAKKKVAKKKVAKKKTAKKATKPTVPIQHPAIVKPATAKEPIPTLDLERFEVRDLIEVGVRDAFFGSTRFAWIGSGQCGGRMVKSFYDLGFKKVIAVNTTHHDLDLLDLPKEQKFLMDIGEMGAGKDMERGQQAVSISKQDILHLARQTFGTEIDQIMICFGAGGGTGGGSVVELIDVAKNFARSIGKVNPGQNVGVIMTLPTIGEASSPRVAQNAYDVATELGTMAAEKQFSPLIIIDNEKISKMYPGMTVKAFWPSINDTVSSLFDVFNRLNALPTRYTTFDPVDYHSILRAGGCAIMGLTKVNEYKDKFALSEAVKKNLGKTLLASGFDLSTAQVAGCIMVGGKKMMANVPGLQDNINFAFDVLGDITGNATIHRGIYEDPKEMLRVYTMIGGLDFPARRIEELIAT